MSNEEWLVYLLECSDGSLYCGATNNLERRVEKHSNKKVKYTRGRLPIKVVYSETLIDKSAALKRECAIKKLSRKQKLELIKNSK